MGSVALITFLLANKCCKNESAVFISVAISLLPKFTIYLCILWPSNSCLTFLVNSLHSERPKLHRVLAILSAIEFKSAVGL